MAIARGTAAISSFIMTTWALSEAAVEVPSVMATPISATASTGASFTPSPTIIVTGLRIAAARLHRERDG